MFNKAISCAALTLVVACGGTEEFNPLRSPGTTTSAFATVGAAGSFASDLTSRSSADIDGIDNGGVAYQVGIRNQSEFRAISGVRSNTAAIALPIGGAGSATYSGTYKLLAIEGIGPGPTGPSAVTNSYDDTFNATVALSTGAFSGASTGTGDRLTANGTVSGTGVTGTVNFNGVSGTMQGLAGTQHAVIAFHGNSSDTTYAGGIALANDNP